MNQVLDVRSAEVIDRSAGVVDRSAAVAAVVALLSWGVGVVHALEVSDHFEWWFAAGVFFAVIAVVQFATVPMVLWRPRPWAILTALWANAGTIIVYVLSRSTGVPGSPGIALHGAKLQPGVPLIPGGIDAVRPVDFLTLVAEVVIVVLLVTTLTGRARRWTIDALCVAGVGLAVNSWAASLL